MVLTDKEQTALLAIAKNGMEEMGGKKPSDLLDDNFSWFLRKDIAKFCDLSSHEASGIMSSLSIKGLIMGPEDDGMWALSEDGIVLAQELWGKRLGRRI